MNNRGQSFTYIIAALMIILAAGLIAIFNSPITKWTDYATDQCTTQACLDGVSNAQAAWDWFPLIVLGFVFLMIIATSIFQSKRPSR